MAVKPGAKKASASTEIVLGQAAQQITKAVAELNNATKAVNELADKAEELTLIVANKEESIKALEVEFAEKERQLKVDLDLSFKANTDRVVTNYLESVQKVAVPTTEINSLRKELEEVKSNREADIKREVSIVSNTLKTQYENEIKLIHSENKAIMAENAAKIGTLATQNKFLEEQVAKLYAQLDAERSAGIERAKAGSVGSINVTSGGK
jgi:nicotinamide mononucleotide adenylyltransferase